MREELKALDDFEMGELWQEVNRRVAEPERPEQGPPRRQPRARPVALLVASVAVIGLVLYGLSGLHRDGAQPMTGPTGSLSTRVDPARIPISVQYPSDWYAAIGMTSPGFTGVNNWIGLVISNESGAVPGHKGYFRVHPDVPTTYVTVQILRRDVPALHGPPMPETPLPLSMTNATDTSGRKNFRYLTVGIGGMPVFISVEVGPDASAADIARADQIVSSIRSTEAPTATIANTAHVSCTNAGVTVDDSVVRAREDGVHFVFDNESNAWAVDLHHESWDYGTAETVPFKDRALIPSTSAIGPGHVTIACLPNAHSSYFDAGAVSADITVVDPERFYVPWDLSCGFGEQFRTRVDAPEDSTPTSVVSEVPGVLDTDTFRRPNYPDSPRYTPTDYIVFRDGEAVARTMGSYDAGDGMWHLLVNACPGAGIQATPNAATPGADTP